MEIDPHHYTKNSYQCQGRIERAFYCICLEISGNTIGQAGKSFEFLVFSS